MRAGLVTRVLDPGSQGTSVVVRGCVGTFLYICIYLFIAIVRLIVSPRAVFLDTARTVCRGYFAFFKH